MTFPGRKRAAKWDVLNWKTEPYGKPSTGTAKPWHAVRMNAQELLSKKIVMAFFLPFSYVSDKLGDPKRAYYYHKKARNLKPDHEAVKQNQAYFERILKH